MIKPLWEPNIFIITFMNLIFIPLGTFFFISWMESLFAFNITKVRKILFISIFTLVHTALAILLPSYWAIITLLFLFILLFILFPKKFYKTCISFFPVGFLISIQLILSLFIVIGTSSRGNGLYFIPVYHLLFVSSFLVILFSAYCLTKEHSWNILFVPVTKKEKTFLILGEFISLFCLLPLLTPITSSYTALSFFFYTLILVAYFFVSILELIHYHKCKNSIESIKSLQTYNQNLLELQDSVDGFKHDMNNILQAIHGYLITDNMSGLRNFFEQWRDDCKRTANLTCLSPEKIDEPAIYILLVKKWSKAEDLGISISLDMHSSLKDLPVKIYELTRILGILLDNSIEAAKECEEKAVYISFLTQNSPNRKLIILQNTYVQKNIDTFKIFEKSYTTKKGNTGIGLWEVNRILKKNDNLSLYTTKNDTLFTQQLEIYLT